MENLLTNHLLTLIVFSPLAGVIVLLAIPRKAHGMIRHIAFIASLVNLALSIQLLRVFSLDTGGMQLEVKIPWIKQFGISYHIGVDGISLLLIALTSFLT
ncbi:MAG: Fe-S-binding domain-containing protein, partial [bacterium]